MSHTPARVSASAPSAQVGRDHWWAASLAALAGASFLFNAAVMLLAGQPVPRVHDEFSYLLAADTFAHGRLTNPPHAFWQHFETVHVLVQPTYMSKYPPGQGLVMALGQWAWDLPVAGVWVSSALACAATAWMLRAFLPPLWSITGGLLALLHPIMLDWSQSYWGGSLAMFGGSLLLGAVTRLVQRDGLACGIVAGSGAAVLANTRPFEGAVLTLLCGLTLLSSRLRRRQSRPSTDKSLSNNRRSPAGGVLGRPLTLGRSIAGFLGVMLPVLLWVGYYNQRITGSVLKLPYVLHEQQYALAPLFLWGTPRADQQYRHESLRSFYVNYTLNEGFLPQRTMPGFFQHAAAKLGRLAAEYSLYGILALPLLFLLPRRRCRPRIRMALVLLLIFGGCMLAPTWLHPHYAAPAFSLFLLPVTAGLRRMLTWRPLGPTLAFILCSSALVILATQVFARIKEPDGPAAVRQRQIDFLRTQRGKHLVFVRYGPNPYVHFEWVYNPADIDAANIVFAHDMGEKRNLQLIEYFADRTVWLSTVMRSEVSFTPYAVNIP